MTDQKKIELTKDFCGVASDGHIELWKNGKPFAETLDPIPLQKDTGMELKAPVTIFAAAAKGQITVDTKENTCSSEIPGAWFAGPKSGTVPFIGNLPKR